MSVWRICFFRAGVNVLLSPKAEIPPETRHDCAVFLIASRSYCKNPSIVLEFLAARSLYEDALTRTARGHPTAR
jgi:hypothetical protein